MECLQRGRSGLIHGQRPPAFQVAMALWACLLLVAAVPCTVRAYEEGPPGANTGDKPATFDGLVVDVQVGKHTGNSSFPFPIEVPPGRNGMQPQLLLSYSHHSGDTMLGQGWDLPIGRIQRSSRKGAPRYDGSDILEVLVPGKAFEIVRYDAGKWAARVDDVHASVIEFGEALIVREPSGVTYVFGNTPESVVRRSQSSGFDSVYAWHLTQVVDMNGNTIDVTYEQRDGYVYPLQMHYGGNAGAGLPHVYTVDFAWSDRPTASRRVSYMAGFRREAARQLDAVTVTRFQDSTKIRRYELSWRPSQINEALLLDEIVPFGAGTAANRLKKRNGSNASTRFEYHETLPQAWSQADRDHENYSAYQATRTYIDDEFLPKQRPFRDWDPEDDPCTTRDFIDLNGDGRPDWVQIDDWADNGGYWTVRYNQGRDAVDNGREPNELFGPEQLWFSPRKCLAFGEHRNPLYNSYEKWGGLYDRIGGSGMQNFRSVAQLNAVMDINGDGLPEYVRTDGVPNGKWWVYFQNAAGTGFESTPFEWQVPKPDTSKSFYDAANDYHISFTETQILGWQEDEEDGHPVITNIETRPRLVYDLLDVNADGLPDLVDVGLGGVPDHDGVGNYGGMSGGEMHVFLNTGAGFALQQVELHGGPGKEPLRQGDGPKRERNVDTELFDLNGDGLPDIVRALGQTNNQHPCGDGYHWYVWYGTGVTYPAQHSYSVFEPPSFEGPHCWDSPRQPHLRAWSAKKAHYDLVDINADGLPDYVNSQNYDGSPYRCIDMDGDGTKETLEDPNTRQNLNMWVWFNTGQGMKEIGEIYSPSVVRRNANVRLDGSSASGGGPLCPPSGDAPEVDTVYGRVTDFFDIDGDGYPDNISMGSKGFLKYNFRHPERLQPNMLTRVTNPLDGITDITYAVSTTFNTPAFDPALPDSGKRHHLAAPIWVVESITKTDPVDGLSNQIKKRWHYEGGYFDGQEHLFRGFRTVEEALIVDDPDRPGQVTEGVRNATVFHQTDQLFGRQAREVVYTQNGHNGILSDVYFTWDVVEQSTVSGHARFVVGLTERLEIDASSEPKDKWKSLYCPDDRARGGYKAKRVTMVYDACGNRTQQTTEDATAHLIAGHPYDRLRRVTQTYKQDLGGGCDTTYRVCNGTCDRVETQQVENGLRQEFGYDARGNLISSTRVGEGDPTTVQEYDSAGRPIKAWDAKGTLTETEYESLGGGIHPTKVTRDKGVGRLNHATTMKWDLRFGKVRERTDIAGVTTQLVYDAFGRLSKVIEPGQTIERPTVEYAYTIDDGGRSRVVKKIYEPNWTRAGEDNNRLEVSFYDAFGRTLQTQAHRQVGGILRTVVEGGVRYDRTGLVAHEFAPVVRPISEWPDAFIELDPLLYAHAAIKRDEFGRERRRTSADGAVTTTSYHQAWSTEVCDAQHAIDSSSGKCITTVGDALERTIARVTRLGRSQAAYAEELYVFGSAGHLESVTYRGDGQDVMTVFDYDDLGRRILVDEPSSGVWSHEYDLNDNMISRRSPKTGERLEYGYDALNRRASKKEFADNMQVRGADYVYDAAAGAGKGRLFSVEQKTFPGGERESLVRFSKYDSRGNIEIAERTVVAGGESLQYTATTAYDEIGRIGETSLPFPGGDEKLTYLYASTGEVESITSDKNGSYVSNVMYDELGRIVRADYGNDVRETFSYHNATGDGIGPGYGFQLSSATSHNLFSNTQLRRLDYPAYTSAGQVLAVIDSHNQDVGSNASFNAAYDDAGRMVTWLGISDARIDYAYDALGRIVSKGGKAYSYSSSKPFQISSYDGQPLGYDENGNIETWNGRVMRYTPGGQLRSVDDSGEVYEYLYDHEGVRTASMAPDGSKTWFFSGFDVVDDQVERKVKRHVYLGGQLIASSTVPFAGTALAQPNPPRAPPIAKLKLPEVPVGRYGLVFLAILILTWFRQPLRDVLDGSRQPALGPALARLLCVSLIASSSVGCGGASVVQDRSANKGIGAGDDIVYYHLDHLSSPQLLTNGGGGVVETQKYKPYGEVTVFGQGGVEQQESSGAFQFTGHRSGESHGLTYFKARYYIPELGVFASLDPARQYANPYSYGGGDPLNGTDPDGKFFSALFTILAVAYTAYTTAMHFKEGRYVQGINGLFSLFGSLGNLGSALASVANSVAGFARGVGTALGSLNFSASATIASPEGGVANTVNDSAASCDEVCGGFEAGSVRTTVNNEYLAEPDKLTFKSGFGVGATYRGTRGSVGVSAGFEDKVSIAGNGVAEYRSEVSASVRIGMVEFKIGVDWNKLAPPPLGNLNNVSGFDTKVIKPNGFELQFGPLGVEYTGPEYRPFPQLGGPPPPTSTPTLPTTPSATPGFT